MDRTTDHLDLGGLARNWGFWAILTGGLAMILFFAQIALPSSFEPQPSTAERIGEIAGEIKRSAWRTFLGLPKPAPEPTPFDWKIYAAMAVPILGVLAILLGVVSGFRKEHWRFPVYGAGLGVAAILFNFIWWLAILIACVVLIASILENMGDIFSFWG